MRYKTVHEIKYNLLGTVSKWRKDIKEERVAIDCADDIFKYAEQIKATVAEYEGY